MASRAPRHTFPPVHDLLRDIGIATIAATAVGVLAHRLRQPIILAYLAAGALIGPVGLGWVAAGENIEVISEIGLVLLLFIIGLEMDLRQLIASGRQLLVAGGGHAMAAGCTIAEEHFEVFERALQQVAHEWLDAETLSRRLATDGPLLPEYRRADVVDALHKEVWGQGFAPPVFSEEVEVVSQRLVGEKHLALKLKHQGTPVDGIWFGHTEPLPAKAVLAFRLDADEWQGVRRVRFLVEAVGE